MAPKKKQQKMALVDFFAETPSSTNWADEMDTLPSAPTKKDPNAPRPGGYLDNMPDRSARPEYSGPPRDEIPIPTSAPFTAFVGNLTFEVEESELREFFGPGTTTSVRLVKDISGKPKGFGYVEFATQQDLKDALDRNMTNMSGRTIRVSVAESQNKRPDGGPSAAESASEWRRSGPLPARDAPQARRAGSFADGPAGPGAESNRDLDWGSARGAKFAPAPPSSDFRRGDSFGAGAGPGGPRDRESTQFGSGLADGANQWRSNKPAAVAVERASPSIGSGQNSPGLADTEQTWSRGTKLRTPIGTPPVSSPAGEDKDREWRGSRAPSATASAEDSPKAPAAPLERRKLNLAPRSQANAGESAPSASKPSSSASPFGAAKPIDTSSREAEVAAKRQEERKKAQEERARKHKEEEDKIKAEADARTKAINDAREAVRLESLGQGQQGGAAQAGGKKPQAARQGSHGPGSQAPRQGSHGPGAGARQTSNSHTYSNGNQGARPNKGGRSNSNQAQKTDDGFEVARGSRRDRERDDSAQAQAQAKKDAPVRKGFSFAAAAGLVDDAGNVEEGEKKETEDVAERLAEVKV